MSVPSTVTVIPASTLLLVIQPVVDQTVVGAIPTLTIKMVLLVKDVPILEMTHSTVKINMILTAAQPDGSVIQLTKDASLESQVRDTILTALATFSAKDHHQTNILINATLPPINVKNALMVTKLAIPTDKLLVETANLIQKTNSNVIKPIQKCQNVISAQKENKLIVKITLLLAKHALPQQKNILAIMKL